MDATKAWEATKHDKVPEVVAMLEMFGTNMTLRNVEASHSISDRLWYVTGWKAMTILVVEIQNTMSLAFESNWDKVAFSTSEKTSAIEHFILFGMEKQRGDQNAQCRRAIFHHHP